MRKPFFNINENLNVTCNISCNSFLGIPRAFFANIPSSYRNRDFNFRYFIEDIYKYCVDLNGYTDRDYELATNAYNSASAENGVGAAAGTVATDAVVSIGIRNTALAATNVTVGVISGAVGTLQEQVGTLETTAGTLSTKTAYMTTPTTPSIRTQFTSDLMVQNPVSMITTFSANMEDGSLKTTNGSVCDLYSNELSFSDATNNQRYRLNMDGLLLYDSTIHVLSTSLSSDGKVNFYNGSNNSTVVDKDGIKIYGSNGINNGVILDNTGLLIYDANSILSPPKSMYFKNNGDNLMYDNTGAIPLIKLSVSNGLTFYNKLYVTFPIINFLSNLTKESSIKLYNVFSVLSIPYNRCTVSINNNGSIYFKSVGSNSNSYDTKISTTNGTSGNNGQGVLNMESINFNLNSTDITSTCNLTCNKLTTNSSDGLNQTILEGDATYIKLNPLQFGAVPNNESINITTVGAINLTGSAIYLNAPLVYGQTSTIISSLVNQVW